MADDFEQKHEEPTPRRLEKAREEGQVARSREVSSLFFLVTAFIFFGLSGNRLILGLKEEMSGYFSQAAVVRIGPDSVNVFAARVLWDFLKTGFPLWGSFLGAAVLSFVVQGGWVWSPKALALKWDRVSPAKGFSRLFSGRSLIELAKYTLKVILVLFILFVSLRKDWMALPQLEETGVHRFVGGLAHFLMDVLVRLVPLFLVIAVLDFLIQRVQLDRSLRMSRAEIRDEFKETDGPEGHGPAPDDGEGEDGHCRSDQPDPLRRRVEVRHEDHDRPCGRRQGTGRNRCEHPSRRP
jgi:flagellar biosynthetic protein FlhB